MRANVLLRDDFSLLFFNGIVKGKALDYPDRTLFVASEKYISFIFNFVPFESTDTLQMHLSAEEFL